MTSHYSYYTEIQVGILPVYSASLLLSYKKAGFKAVLVVSQLLTKWKHLWGIF